MEWFYLIFTILQMKESEYLLVGSYLLIFHIIHVGMDPYTCYSWWCLLLDQGTQIPWTKNLVR